MATKASLQEKFNAAVRAIQQLPNDGTFQPSNEMKLTFYGLYKQATVGQCNESRPSVFNYINRAKWDAWNKYRSMTKEAAMSAYIDEIRKILETMPQTNEVLEFTQLIGPFYEFVDDHTSGNESSPMIKQHSHHKQNNIGSENSLDTPIINGTNSHVEYMINHTNGPQKPIVSAGTGSVPSSSPSSSSSSISSSDAEECYGDPSDRLPLNSQMPNDNATSRDNLETKDEPMSIVDIQPEEMSNNTEKTHPHVYGGQNENNPPVHRPHRENNHSSGRHESSMHSAYRTHDLSDGTRYSFSSAASAGGAGHHPNNNYNRETQRAILAALTKLQRDVNNILERLNRLETSSYVLQQRELSTQSRRSSESKSLSRWLPLAGLRRRAIAFILLWPFFVFALIRLFLRARIIIRFRQPHL